MTKTKAKKFQVVTVGGATRDILFYSSEGELVKTANPTKQKLLAFEYGAKILADNIYLAFGGGAANSAVSFARLGLKTAAVCQIGDDDNGQAVSRNLAENGVALDLVKKIKGATGFSLILTVNNEAKEHVAFLYRGANDLLSENNLPAGDWGNDWFYVTSLPAKNWERIMAVLAKSRKKIVWNPGQRQLAAAAKVNKFLPQVEVLILNRDEAMEFRKLKDIKGLLAHIRSLGPKLVVITDGDNGAYVYDGKKYYFMKAKKLKAVNTLGVGDAFGSAFTAALIYGKNIKQALGWGITNSAAVVAKIGAQAGLLKRRQVK